MTHDFQNDIDSVQRIAAVSTILDVACRTTGMGFAAVARVTEERWIACQVLDNIGFGLAAGGELEVETTLCHEIRNHRKVVAIDNVAEDAIYCAHHTPKLYGLQSYISVPIVLPGGAFFGTLCAIDPSPARVNNSQTIATFTLFAELIAYHLDAEERVQRAEAKAADQASASEVREQFIAVLGHDLRNPLAAIDAGANKLLRDGWTDRSPTILRLMKNSVVRMSGLIDNVLDLARSRLGGGIVLNLEQGRPLQPTLVQVLDEIRAAYPERLFEVNLDVSHPAHVDHSRIAQMFSNLLGNAVTHGADDRPIRIEGLLKDTGMLELSVSNAGEPISPEMIEHLFKAFHRGQVRNNAEGLGLGLYIASQIAEAHGGTIDVRSDQDGTSFTFRMPAQ